LVFSQSVGLHYYQATSKPYGTQWEFPKALVPVPSAGKAIEDTEPQELEFTPQWSLFDVAPYLQRSREGEARCLLCNATGKDHLASQEHSASVEHWHDLVNLLKAVEKEVLRLPEHPFPSNADFRQQEAWQRNFMEAWRGEILAALQSEKTAGRRRPERLLPAFWHLVVRPNLPSEGNRQSLLDAVQAMLRIAQAPEVAQGGLESFSRSASSLVVIAEYTAPPQRGVDFAWYPAPLPITLRLNERTPPEVFNALRPQALLGEGIEADESGIMFCDYCSRPVRKISEHLNPRQPEAQAHRRNRISRFATMDLFKSSGSRLRLQGVAISNKRFECRLCNEEGKWHDVWAHCESTRHVSKAQALPAVPEPSAEECRAWKEAFQMDDPT
jgi:hypothetical protein